MERRRFSLCEDLDGDQIPDFSWFATDSSGGPHWNDPKARTICLQLDASATRGELVGRRIFFIYNAHFETQHVQLPSLDNGIRWHRAIDTSLAAGLDIAEEGKEIPLNPAEFYFANPRSTVVLIGKA